MTQKTYQEYELDFYAEILATHPTIESLEEARNKIHFLRLRDNLTIDEAGKFLLDHYNLKIGQ